MVVSALTCALRAGVSGLRTTPVVRPCAPSLRLLASQSHRSIQISASPLLAEAQTTSTSKDVYYEEAGEESPTESEPEVVVVKQKRRSEHHQKPVIKRKVRQAGPPIQHAEQFINAIARPRRGDLKAVLTAIQTEAGGDEAVTQSPKSMATLLSMDGFKLKGAAVPVKERRYFLWCLERFKQGMHPDQVAYDVKPPKKIRGWGPKIQNGMRVRGMLRRGEKKMPGARAVYGDGL